MKKRLRVFAMVCAITAVPAVAAAQEQVWLKDRRYTEGIGYRVGNLELHPGIGAEFGYDSNFFRRGPEDAGGPVGSLRLRIVPSLSLSTLSQQRRELPNTPPPDIEFRTSMSATYHEFFPVSGPQAGQDAMSKNRTFSGLLDASMDIFPGRVWSGTLQAGIARTITPSTQGIATESFNRISPRAGAEVAWTPGGGLFDWRLGYNFNSSFFEASQFSRLNNFQHEIRTRGRWRFLPRTALMFDGRFGFISYPDSSQNGKTDSTPMRALLGINGLITPSFSLLALAGWGASFYSTKTAAPPEDFNSVIGQVELRWYLSPNPSTDPANASLSLSSLTVGFSRDFFDSFIGTYGERNRGYATLSHFFAGRFLVVVDGGVGPISYPKMPMLEQYIQPTSARDGFTDVRIDASLFGEYRFKDYLGLNATLRYGQNISPAEIVIDRIKDQLSWQQFEAYLGFRWFM